jgi:nucleotide-sensitive chloride channel 1A
MPPTTPLSEHQSHTPEVFYGAKPILHHHANGARALIARDKASKLPIFSQTPEEVAPEAVEEEQPERSEGSIIVEVIDIYISSE